MGLVAFTAGKQSSTVRLKRQTASERNSARFEAERSPDGQRFGRIGEVAAQGTTASPTDYALLDEKLPAGTATRYYRLRQVDTDGKAAYSPVRVVQVGSKALLILWPNPAHGEVRVLGATAGAPLEVFDATGRRISTATGSARAPCPVRGRWPRRKRPLRPGWPPIWRPTPTRPATRCACGCCTRTPPGWYPAPCSWSGCRP